MSSVVIDANVAVKWVIDEIHSDRARRLYTDTVATRDRFLGPPMLISEVINIIYQRRRSRDPARNISEAEADAALARFLVLPIRVVAAQGLYERSFTFARVHALSNTYDSLYVVLAQLLGVEMWTDDRALLNALGSGAPWVRAIADYPLGS